MKLVGGKILACVALAILVLGGALEIAAPGQAYAASHNGLENPGYNRLYAVSWALAHAQDPQTNGELCAKFVSEALWAGGLPQSPSPTGWNNNGHYRSGITIFAGSKTANSAPMLLHYLKDHFSSQWIPLGPMNAGNNNVPQAEAGDIIAYDWGNSGKGTMDGIDHLAFIVGDAQDNPQYPLVAEWGQFAHFGPWDYVHNPRSPYGVRGWTYSEINHMFLQQEKGNQNMTVSLLHFNGGIL